jgi:prepilin-type N-terminal cleavage/methylation domain-containing protein
MNKILKTKNKLSGFTLLEMLLVIAIIAILAGIVIVAINPGRQLAQARNTQRMSDLRALHSAVNQYYIDNLVWPGNLEDTLTTGTMEDICKYGEPEVNCISLDVLVPTYISVIPVDPLNVASANSLINTAHAQATNLTGYRIGINPTSETPNLLAVNSNEYDLETQQIMAECGDPTDARCWSGQSPTALIWGPTSLDTGVYSETNGKLNTRTLIDREESFPAAQFCEDSTHGGYTDWYLPAKDQLSNGPDAHLGVGIFSDIPYWSSTEVSDIPSFPPENNAWHMGYDFMYPDTPKEYAQSVRCLR